MIDEPTQPDIDPTEAGAAEDAPDVEGHRKPARKPGRKPSMMDDTDDGPDFEGHARRHGPEALQRKR